MWLMEQSCICYIPAAAPNGTLITPSFSLTTLLSDFCPPDQMMLPMVQPSYLTHLWFSIQIVPYLQNYLHCNIKRGLKCHRGLSVKGKSRIWLCLPSGFGKGWAPRVWKCPGQLQGGAWGEKANNAGEKPGLRWHCWGKHSLDSVKRPKSLLATFPRWAVATHHTPGSPGASQMPKSSSKPD